MSPETMACSVARTLNIIGEWWTLLVLRDVFYGIRRFDALRRHLGISRKVLASRLNTLVEHKVLERALYQRHPDRYEYRLTERGRELFPVIVMLMAWGDKWLSEPGESPIQLVERDSGEALQPLLINTNSGREVKYGSVQALRGSPAHEDAWQQLQQGIADSQSEAP